MSINEILSRLLVRTGLKKSEVRLCEDAISAHENRIKDINDQIAGQMSKIETLERRLHILKKEYDAASPAAKPLYEAKLRSCMHDFKLEKELQSIKMRNLNKEKLLLQNRRIELECLLHPVDPDAVDEVQDVKKDILSELEDEDGRLEELGAAVYEHSDESVSGVDMPDRDREIQLERDFAALLGNAEKKAEHAEPLSDEPGEIA